jgi:Histidinol phosphatase and related hydrolases of the PHP family
VPWFSIGSDAHSANELEFLPFGMATAALAGIPREQILNYQARRLRQVVGCGDDGRPMVVHDVAVTSWLVQLGQRTAAIGISVRQ